MEGKAVFAVRDNGPGIEAHHIDKLTERFYRVDSAMIKGKVRVLALGSL